MVGVMWWRKSQRRNIPREKKKLFIHFVFRHNIISIQILSKCWGYSYLLMLSFLMDRFEGHFPHHPAFSTLISGFRSLKFYWLYKTVVHHIAFFSIHNSKELLPTNTIHIDTLYPFVILFFWISCNKEHGLGLKSWKLGVLFCMQKLSKLLRTTIQYWDDVMGLEYWGRWYWIQWPLLLFDAMCWPPVPTPIWKGAGSHHQRVRVRSDKNRFIEPKTKK